MRRMSSARFMIRKLTVVLLPAVCSLATWTNVAHAQAPPQTDDSCIEASDKAITLRKAGKLLDARAQLSYCSSPACPDVVRTSCDERLSQIISATPTIVFDVKGEDGADLGDVKLTIDGVLHAARLGGGTISLDPVEHEFRFEAPDRAPVIKHYVLHEGEARREQVTIGRATGPGAPEQAPPPPPPPAADQPAPSRWGPSRIGGWSAIGASVIAAGIGSAYGLTAISKKNEADQKSNCPDSNTCYPQGAELHKQASQDATVSTVLFIVSGAALAGGITLLVLAPSPATAPSSAPSPRAATSVRLSAGARHALAGLTLEGAW